MKSTVACLLVLAVAVQAQLIDYGYGLGGYGGYYPFAGIRSTPYATGYPIGATPTAYPYYGYPAVTTSQYHAQDELGQARFGYAHPGQAATNYQDPFGNQVGSYAYFNPEGKQVQVSYTADHRGFRVLSNDLPVAPVAPVASTVANLPVQVQDTPEVAAAKQAHALQWAAAAAAAAAAPDTTSPVAGTAPVTRTKRQAVQAFNTPLAYNYGTTPLAYNYGSPLAYNYASPYGYNYGSPLAYTTGSPLAYGVKQGTSFGYNFASPIGYNQYPYGAYPFYNGFGTFPVSQKTTKTV